MSAASFGWLRLRQGFHALGARAPAYRDDILRQHLTPIQSAAFRELPNHDQAHLLRVYRALLARGVTDSDLLVAGLLHDLGKVSSRGSVRICDRATKVLLARLSPRLLARLARSPDLRWRHGLWLAVHHAQLGAARAAALGCTARTCWLIEHHEELQPHADPELGLLIAVDRETV